MTSLRHIGRQLFSAKNKWKIASERLLRHQTVRKFRCNVVLSKTGVLEEGENPKGIQAAEWRSRLTPEQYHVCREKGTEQPFVGDLTHNKAKGTYSCACCGTPLFSSSTKFDSGSGWPSFYDIITSNNVREEVDVSCGMQRTEALCRVCDSHLGHVFNDGPRPTGLRYCINSVSLQFDADS